MRFHWLEIAGENNEARWRWVQMRSIGDRMLFVGIFQGFSFRTVDSARFKGNKLEKSRRQVGCIRPLQRKYAWIEIFEHLAYIC